MRARKLAIGIVAAAGLLVSGCSSGGDGDDEATTGTTVEATSDAPDDDESTPVETSDDGDGDDVEASDEAVAWVGEFCGIMAPVTEDFTGMEEMSPDDPEAVALVIEAFQQMGPRFGTALEETEALGPPPVENGEELHAAMITAFQTLRDVFAQVQPQLDALDPADPASLEAMTPVFTQLLPQMEQAFSGVDETVQSPELDAAFDEAPACQDLELGVS